MSVRKKMKRARRLLAAADAIIAELMAQLRRRDDTILALSRRIRDVEDSLRPAVERIAGVRYGTRWYFHDPVEIEWAAATEERLATMVAPQSAVRQRYIDTHRKRSVEYRIADEVLRELVREGGETAADFFVQVGSMMLRRVVTEILEKENPR